MSKTKTKRMVASFLLLCAMSGSGVLAADRLIMTQDETVNGLSGITTENNGSGGAIVNNGFNVKLNGTYDSNKLINNKGASFGGVLYQQSGSINSSNATFSNNIVTAADQTYPGWSGVDSSSGGAMYIGGNTTGEFNNVNFSNNKALTVTTDGQSNGGAIFAQSAGKLTFTGGSFENNSSISRGGAFYNGDTYISFNGTSFSGNSVSNGSGGAIYSLFGTEALKTQNDFTNVSFTSNTAGNSGGAIANYSGLVNITGGSFTGNKATSLNGGAILNDTYWEGHTATLNIKGSAGGTTSFSGNTAGNLGGAIYSSGITSIDATAGAISFSGNSDSSGANDIYLKNSIDQNVKSTLNLTGSQNITFASGIAGENNTQIKSTASDLTLKGSNKNFKGSFTQTGGEITVSNNSVTQGTANVLKAPVDQATFFGGTNSLNNVDLTFDSGTLVAGQNDWKNTEALIHDGAGFDVATTVKLSDSVLTFGDTTDTNSQLTTALNIAIEGDDRSEIKKDGAGVLSISVAQDKFNGSFTQTNGITDLSSGFFKNAAINGGVLNLNSGSNIEASTITLANSDMNIKTDTTINGNVSGSATGKINLNTNVNLHLTGDNSNFTGEFSQSAGTVNVGDSSHSGVSSFAGTNNISGGILNVNNNSILKGTSYISDAADVNINSSSVEGTMNISGGNVELTNSSTIAKGAQLNITGGNLEINQDITLGGSQITGKGSTASITMNGDMTINGDMSGYEGTYSQKGGQIDITDGKFFGGESSIAGVKVNLKGGGELSGTKIDVSGTTINVTNSGRTGMDGLMPTYDPDANDVSVISADLKKGTDSAILVSGENTYLIVEGDQSEYKGIFSQIDGATTEVTGKFFGGNSTISDGNFIFRDTAQLVNNVVVDGEDVNLVFGDGSQQYVIEDGNMVYTGDTTAEGEKLGFELSNVRIQGSLFTDGTEEAPKGISTKMKFGDNGGLGSGAHYEVGNEKGNGTLTFETGSVAQDGSTLKVNEGSVLNIIADTMKTDATTTESKGAFGTDISGDGVVNISNKQTTIENALKFTSDNSEFKGSLIFNEGYITFSGVDADNKNEAKFFGSENNQIGNGTDAAGVIFGENSAVYGKNIVKDNASIVLDDGSRIDASAGIDLDTNGTLDIINDTKDVTLTIGVEGDGDNANINKTEAGTLVISKNQDTYTGVYNHIAGTTKLGEGFAFFAGKNNITGGVVDATAKDAVLKGENTVTGNGNMLIGDDTVVDVTNGTITVGSADSNTGNITLKTQNDNDKDLNVNFNIASGAQGAGTVSMNGDGALNLNDPKNNLNAFTGVFDQIGSGITNVFGKFFGGTNNIQTGTLNLKDGAEIVEGSVTTIEDGAVLNIGTLTNDPTKEYVEFTDKSNVKIAGAIEGTGDVNISQGNVTLASTSINDAFEGDYRQTGGVVTAENNSTFFGGNNVINNGTLVFKNQANLTDNKTVTLEGSTDLTGTGNNDNQAVLNLDNRDGVSFSGNVLTVAKNETFTFVDGVLENAKLSDAQNIGNNAIVTMRGDNSGFAEDAVVTINDGANVILGTGATVSGLEKLDVQSTLTLAGKDTVFDTNAIGNGIINVTKDPRELDAPSVTVSGDQTNFEGKYLQDAGSVTVSSGSTFFGGENTVTGNADKGTGGDLHLAAGSYLGNDLKVTNSVQDGGATDAHGRVFVEDKLFDSAGNELIDINKLMQGDLYYNAKYDDLGNVVTNELKHISIESGGLILSNGTVFDGSQGPTVFEKDSNGGVVDIGFSNGSGVDGDIELREDTMLSYGDNAFIKDDSTLTMDDNAILNFINDTATINYNPLITGGGAIYKEGLATTNISSAIDMKGEVVASEGTLNFTNKDKVIFNKADDGSDGAYGRQTGNLVVGGDNSSAVVNISANQTKFAGNVEAKAQDGAQSGLYLNGANTTIGGNLSASNTATSFTGNGSVGGNWTTSGNSSLNLLGGNANQITVGGDFVVENMKDGSLPIGFDYDPRQDKIDQILVSGDYVSDSPLLITGINFLASPRDAQFDLSADRLFQIEGQGEPTYAPTSFLANTAMGRYFISNGASGGADLMGNLVYLNPQQYRGQVATLATWQNQLIVNNLLFDHMNLVTRQLMDEERTANKYAAAVPQIDPYQYSIKDGSLWFKAYGAFETLSMTKGLNVGNNAYGSLIGADFPLVNLKNGWKLVPTAYIGYNGAHQHFNGVSMYQNGAQLGLMGTAYKGDFMTSLLAYGGGYGNDMTVRGEFGNGSDNTGNWFAGVASKTAYNIRLPHDFIIQPTLMAAYNAFGQQNWGSDFGVLSMSSGMLNGLNVAPGVNFILQKKTFSLYATAQLVYNVMGGVDGKAGNIDLGYVRMRHCYFEYGLGVMKKFKDRFSGYLQFTIRNGGRTGIGFSGGLNWKVGK